MASFSDGPPSLFSFDTCYRATTAAAHTQFLAKIQGTASSSSLQNLSITCECPPNEEIPNPSDLVLPGPFRLRSLEVDGHILNMNSLRNRNPSPWRRRIADYCDSSLDG